VWHGALRPLARRLTGLDLSAAKLGHARAGAAYDRLEHAAVRHDQGQDVDGLYVVLQR
jgi:predicted TPR repeat methyltransferase